jgi:DNA-binding XRE family transcriptional regulator
MYFQYGNHRYAFWSVGGRQCLALSFIAFLGKRFCLSFAKHPEQGLYICPQTSCHIVGVKRKLLWKIVNDRQHSTLKTAFSYYASFDKQPRYILTYNKRTAITLGTGCGPPRCNSRDVNLTRGISWRATYSAQL